MMFLYPGFRIAKPITAPGIGTNNSTNNKKRSRSSVFATTRFVQLRDCRRRATAPMMPRPASSIA